MKHVPTHRAPKASPLAPLGAPAKAARHAVLLSGVAVAATGVAVSGGLVGASGEAAPTVAADVATLADTQADVPQDAEQEDAEQEAAEQKDAPAAAVNRAPIVSRSDRRETADPAKTAALSDDVGQALSQNESLSDSDPRDIARALMPEFGFSSDQFSCLDSLYIRESGWSVTADNPTSSAYGIPQALPGSKMSSAGADWATNPVTQIRWGLGYIQDRYGSPCGALGFSDANGWY